MNLRWKNPGHLVIWSYFSPLKSLKIHQPWPPVEIVASGVHRGGRGAWDDQRPPEIFDFGPGEVSRNGAQNHPSCWFLIGKKPWFGAWYPYFWGSLHLYIVRIEIHSCFLVPQLARFSWQPCSKATAKFGGFKWLRIRKQFGFINGKKHVPVL